MTQLPSQIPSEQIKTVESNLIPAIAMHLQGWHKDTDVHQREFIQGPNYGEKLWLQIRNVTGKGQMLQVSGDLRPDGKCRKPSDEVGDEPISIGMSLAKSPEQMAKDIKTRLLPGYRKVLADILNQMNKEQERAADQLTTSKRFATALGKPTAFDNERDRQRSLFSFSDARVDVYLYNIQFNAKSVSFEVRSCPVELAEKIGAVIREHYEEKFNDGQPSY